MRKMKQMGSKEERGRRGSKEGEADRFGRSWPCEAWEYNVPDKRAKRKDPGEGGELQENRKASEPRANRDQKQVEKQRSQFI